MTWKQRLQSFVDTILKPPLGQIAADRGRISDVDSVFDDTNSDQTWRNEGPEYYARMSEDAIIWAALDYRDVSRIWVSAKPIETENFKHPGQLLPAIEDNDEEIYNFVAWNLDERLDRPLENILQLSQLSYEIYGFAALELVWRNEDTEFGPKAVISDICDVDPQRIIIKRVWSDGTPVSREQQGKYRFNDYTRLACYLRRWYTSPEDLIEFPDRKLALIINKGMFGNPYGQSELKPLIKPEFSARQISQFWDRHLERHGSPQMIHYYSATKEGSQWDSWRQQQLATISKMQNQSVIQVSENGKLEALQATGETQSFKDRLEALERRISIVLCGSATALMEGKTGARAKEESTTVRQKSAKEQYDCSLLEGVLNYQIIKWLVDVNYGEQRYYPYVQMIPPQSITPTAPENQQQLSVQGVSAEDDTAEPQDDTGEPTEPQEGTKADESEDKNETPKEFAEQAVTEKKTAKIGKHSRAKAKSAGFPTAAKRRK